MSTLLVIIAIIIACVALVALGVAHYFVEKDYEEEAKAITSVKIAQRKTMAELKTLFIKDWTKFLSNNFCPDEWFMYTHVIMPSRNYMLYRNAKKIKSVSKDPVIMLYSNLVEYAIKKQDEYERELEEEDLINDFINYSSNNKACEDWLKSHKKNYKKQCNHFHYEYDEYDCCYYLVEKLQCKCVVDERRSHIDARDYKINNRNARRFKRAQKESYYASYEM